MESIATYCERDGLEKREAELERWGAEMRAGEGNMVRRKPGDWQGRPNDLPRKESTRSRLGATVVVGRWKERRGKPQEQFCCKQERKE